MLRARGLSVDRGAMTVVRDLDLDLARGGALGLLGLNGAGKTTVAEGILGLLPTRGVLELGGVSIAGVATSIRARRGLALVPQGRRLIARMTVDENLATASLAPLGRGPALDVHALFPALRELGSRKAGVLSGGQQQQVAIARALLRRPEVLVLDEPTEGLAPSLIAEIVRALQELRREGLSLLLTEQHDHVIAAVCDDFLALRAGRPVALLPATAENLDAHARDL
jgi:ABC-type branched-subunit amino acid transport system ATPase component